MIRVTCSQAGGAIDVWINPDHILKCWKRLDNITMLRFVNGETMQIEESVHSLVRSLEPPHPPMPTDYVSQLKAPLQGAESALASQAKQLHHLNTMVEAFLRAYHSADKTNSFYIQPTPSYYGP